MPTYTNLGIKKITTGDESGTWGTSTNTNFDYFDTSIVGYIKVTITAATPNICKIPEYNAALPAGGFEGRNRVIEFYSATSISGVEVQIDPNTFEGYFFVRNSLAGGQSLTLYQGSTPGNGIVLANGGDYVVRCDGGGVGATVTNLLNNLRLNSLYPTIYTGDFSNATLTSRTVFKTATTNGNTNIDVIPNGTATTAALRAYGNTTQTNANSVAVSQIDTTEARIAAEKNGTATAQPITFYTDGTERMRVGATDGVLNIGSTSSLANITVRNEILSTDESSGVNLALRKSHTSDNPSIIALAKSRGTAAAPTIVNASDIVGTVVGYAYDGANYQTTASMSFIVDNTPGAGDMPGRVSFYTSADAGTTLTERLRIDSAGLVSVATGGVLTSPSYTTTGSYKEKQVALSAGTGTITIDLATGNYFSKTIAAGTTTFNVSNVPTSTNAISFILDLTSGGLGTIVWGFNPKWQNGTPPSGFSTTTNRDVLVFYTYDGGTTWTGIVVASNVS